MIDPDHERQRLTELYASMSDGELLKVYGDFDELTEPAREAIAAEMRSRNLQPPPAPRAISPEDSEYVMIRQFRDLPEAMLAKSSLESAGITCHLSDENMVRLDWFISNLLGGVKLFVPFEEMDAAEAVLRQEPPASFEVEGIGNYKRPGCPRCGSIEIGFEELNKPVAYGSAGLLGIPIPLHHKGWRCHECGHKWTQEDGRE
jgi:hypothetical protein